MLPPYDPLPFSLAAGASTVALMQGAGLFCGFTIVETAGGAFLGTFWDGQAASGFRIGNFSGVASGIDRAFYNAPFLAFHNGITIQQTGVGTVTGSAFVIPSWRIGDDLWARIVKGDTYLAAHPDVDDLTNLITGSQP